ncbi:unnamed protein product [[Candida] boidinii]|nr:unnamed protein product [[Candida] boidinii]
MQQLHQHPPPLPPQLLRKNLKRKLKRKKMLLIDPSKPFNEDDYKNINLYPGALLPPSKISPQNKKSIKFTSVEDEVILELIRRNPHLRATHSFFTQIATLPSLSGHTGNSVRFRFRKVITPNLDFVYDVDPKTNELKLDPETKEPIKIQELPELIKSQYTAEEDYILCSKILNFKQNASGITPASSSKLEPKESDESIEEDTEKDEKIGKEEPKSEETSNGDATTTESSKDSFDAAATAAAAAAAASTLTSALKAAATIPSVSSVLAAAGRKRRSNPNAIPESLFQELKDVNPRHSAMSWRDRYRKFASQYGLDKYVAYYEECLKNGEAPQPMKNLSSRANRSDGSRKRKREEAEAAAAAAAATASSGVSSSTDDKSHETAAPKDKKSKTSASTSTATTTTTEDEKKDKKSKKSKRKATDEISDDVEAKKQRTDASNQADELDELARISVERQNDESKQQHGYLNDADEARAVASLASAVSADTTRIAREAAAVVEAATGSTETDIDGVVSDETKDDKSDPNAMSGANIFEIMEEAHKALEEHLKSENAAQKALESVDSLTKISPIDNRKDKDTDELIKTVSESFEKAKTEKMSKSEIFQLLFEKASVNSKWSSHWAMKMTLKN